MKIGYAFAFAAVAAAGVAAGVIGTQVAYGPRLTALAAVVSRCDADEQTRRDLVNGMQQFSKPYTGPEL